MTDTSLVIRLGPSSDDLGVLAESLRGASGADVTIRVDPDRPLATPEIQIVLAALQDPQGPSALRAESDGPRLATGLRLLGLADRIEVAA